MALSERLAILITANPESAVRGFEKVGKAAEKNLGKAESKSKQFGATLTHVGAGMAAFGGIALLGLGKLAEESEKSTLANIKLENSLKNNPNIANKSTKAYEDLADSIQSYSSVANESIVSGEAVLAQMGLTAAQIKSLTPLVTDLAVKFGKSMPDAAKAVGKAVNGSAGALGRYGIVLDKTALKTDAYKTVQDGLSKSVGGFAKEQGATFTGQLQRMKNELQDLEEGVGKGAVSAFTNLFGVVDKASSALSGLSGSTQSTIGEVATYGSVALVAVGATSSLIGMLIKAKGNFSLAATGAKDFAASINTARVAQVGLFAGAVVGGYILLDKYLDKVAGDLQHIKGNVGDVVADLRRLGETGAKGRLDIGGLADDFGQLDKKFGEGDSNIRKVINALGGGSQAAAEFASKTRAAKKDIDNVDKALASLVSSGHPKEAKDAYDNLTASLVAQGVPLSHIPGAFDDYNRALGTDKANKAADGAKNLKDKLDPLGVSAYAAGTKFQSLNDEINNYLGIVLGADAAAGEFQKAINDQADAVKAAGGHFNDATDKSIDFNTAQRDTVQKAADVLQALRDEKDGQGNLIHSTGEVTARQKELATQYYLTAIANGVPKAVAEKYRDAILGIPTKRKTVLQVTLDTAAADKKLRDLFNQLNQLAGPGGQVTGPKPGFSAHASGGSLSEGWNVVGERGPELISKSGSRAKVFTNQQSKGMVGGRSFQQINHITIQGDVSKRTVQHLVNELDRHTRAFAGSGSVAAE